jgi:hypothetical protein
MPSNMPPWVWVIVAILVLLIGAWATNVACPSFGRSCKPVQAPVASATTLTADQQKLIESYF